MPSQVHWVDKPMSLEHWSEPNTPQRRLFHSDNKSHRKKSEIFYKWHPSHKKETHLWWKAAFCSHLYYTVPLFKMFFNGVLSYAERWYEINTKIFLSPFHRWGNQGLLLWPRLYTLHLSMPGLQPSGDLNSGYNSGSDQLGTYNPWPHCWSLVCWVSRQFLSLHFNKTLFTFPYTLAKSFNYLSEINSFK